MQVFVRHDRTRVLHVDVDATWGTLLSEIGVKFGMCPCMIRLVHNGKPLYPMSEDRVNIPPDCTLQLLLRAHHQCFCPFVTCNKDVN